MVDRIQKIILAKKLTASKFADQIGVPRSTISHILSGRNNPSLEFLLKILDTYPDIKTEWLIRGDGPMQVITNSLFSEADFLPDDIPGAASKQTHEDPLSEGSSKQSEKSNQDIDNQISDDNKPKSIPPDTGEIFKESNREATVGDEKKDKEGHFEKDIPIHDQNKRVGFNQGEVNEKSLKIATKAAKIIIIYTDGTFSEHMPA